jgi:GTP-binding protein EngB required for normal cell division
VQILLIIYKQLRFGKQAKITVITTKLDKVSPATRQRKLGSLKYIFGLEQQSSNLTSICSLSDSFFFQTHHQHTNMEIRYQMLNKVNTIGGKFVIQWRTNCKHCTCLV